MVDVLDLPSDAAFYELAPVYDFVYRRGEDYDAQAALVREAAGGGDVLELGCGTGALAERLSGSGSYVGVDASASMLAVARRNVDDAEADAALVRADARRVAFDRRFDAVAMLGRSASHFDREDLSAAADVARSHLTAGAFVVDAHDLATLEDGYTSEDVYESARWSVCYRGHSTRTGGARCEHEYGLEVTDRETGRTRTFEGRYEMRFWGTAELEALLGEAGFDDVDVEATDGVVRAVASVA
jgi:SAM-dependent methyltransferase